MEPASIALISFGILSLFAGLGGSLLPVLPGPPLTALGNLLIQLGLGTGASEGSWICCILSIFLGIFMTIADFMAPGIVANMGGSSKTSGRYALIGVIFACFVSCTGGGPITAVTGGLGAIPSVFIGMSLILGFAYFGGRIGELQELPSDEPNRVERAHKAGLAHMVGLGMSMAGKLIYATLGFGFAIAQFLLA